MEIIENKKYSHLVENQVLEKYAYLDKRDRSFYTRLTEGTLECLLTLDYVIDSFAGTKVKKQKPLIRCLLRMSVYQILYMDNIPDSAAINEAVKIAKRRGFTSLSGFVNGVLRTISREKENLKFPSEKDNLLKAYSVKYSMPEWITDLFIKERGQETSQKILENFARKYPLTARVNLTHLTREDLIRKLGDKGIKAVAVDQTEAGITLEEFDSLTKIQEFRQGDFYIQDPSSMLVAQWAGIKEDDYVIDVCAAPGGKALHVSEILKGTGHVEARDLTDYKVDLIRENISRSKADNISAKCFDATVADPEASRKADVVICDAPCSGLGVLGKKKDIRYNVTSQSVEDLSALQQKILSTVCDYVKPGGVLMYSTCTITKAENENNVELFLKEHEDFTLDFKRQLLPGEIGNDGFFVARLVRKK